MKDLGENTIVDAQECLQNTALFAKVAGSDQLLGRTAAKGFPWGMHPIAGFRLIAEDF